MLDEPSTALDFAAAAGLATVIRVLVADGQTLVLVTHHPGEIPPEIGRVVLLERGRIRADGPKRKVLNGVLLGRLFGLPLRIS